MVRARRLLASGPLLLWAAAWGACSSSSAATTPATIPEEALGGSCGAKVVHVAPTSANHLEPGTVIAYATNPPSGGDHYPIWATWGAHTAPLPAGYWVHNEEHGGVVLLYRCADRAACPALAAQVEAVAAALPRDPSCDADVPNRVVVLPDPDLPADVQIAAAAWGYAWTASCFDAERLRAFTIAAEGHGPEDECAQGSVSFDDAGVPEAGPPLPDAAGAPDAADGG